MRLALVLAFSLGCGRTGFDYLLPTGSGSPDDGGGDGNEGADGSGDLDGGDGGGGGGGGGDDDAGGGDGAAVTSDSGTSDAPMLAYNAWFTNLAASTPPSARRSTGATTEPSTPERIWIYGGYNGSFLGDLVAYNTQQNVWSTIAGTGTPPGTRERHSLAFDPVGNAVVVFGGQNLPMFSFVHYDTLHIFKTATSVWTQIPRSGTWPAARKDAALFWVPHLGKLLLFGGDDGPNAGNRFNDMFLLTLDSANNTASWSQITPGGVTPPKQTSGCIAYDPTGHRLIVYGGETSDGTAVNTTYQYLLDSNTWQLDSPTGTPPPGESFSQCAWDPVSSRVLLYGGQNNGGAPVGGAYAYDPTAKQWSSPPLKSGSPNPGNHSDGSAVYSPALGAVFWFGGRTATITYTNEAWTYDMQ